MVFASTTSPGHKRSFRPRLSFAGVGRRLAGLFFCWLTYASFAHDPGLSTATVRLETNKLEATLGFSIVDASQLVEVDNNQDGKYSKEERAEAAAALKELAHQALEIKFDEETMAPTQVRCEFDENDNAYVYLTFPSKPFTKLLLRSKWLMTLPRGHVQFLSLQNVDGTVLAERLLNANSDFVTIQTESSSEVSKMGDTNSYSTLIPSEHGKPVASGGSTTFADFLIMGVKHIWVGYDHLLFLFGLLIVTRNFAASVKIITCFTIAHSITLAVATLSLVQISSKWVEPLIAASIVYVGVENLLRGDDPKGRWLLTFAFGLIHGFGFAGVLRELGVGAGGSGITVPLVSFNLGVEVGQIVIAGIVLPIIWKLRANPFFVTRWVPACSIVVALLGGYWFVQRVWF